ncbi:PPC domain-containing protein, partial [Dethiothermospora halolimnae]|uniref:PPC domain-containing protein n=1 Tax=Dethiothermospora halolimnae TaxID=3114390 RepID=UPI003CCBB3E6
IVGFDGDYDRNDEYRLYIDSDYDPNAVRRDEYEKNNEADDASEIDVEEGRREEIYGTIHHEDDVDWYEFEVDGYSDLDIELNNIPRDCNYDIKLYRKDGRYTDLIESSRRSGDKSEDIRETVEKSTYYVKIYGDGYDDFDVEDEYELEIRYRYNDDDSYYAPDGGVWVSDKREATDEQRRYKKWYSCRIYIPAYAIKALKFDNSMERKDFINLSEFMTVGGITTFFAEKMAKKVPAFVGWAGAFFTVAGGVMLLSDFSDTETYNDFLDTIQPGGEGTKIYPVCLTIQPGFEELRGGYEVKVWRRWNEYPRIPKAIDGQLGELEDRELDKDDVEDLIPE